MFNFLMFVDPVFCLLLIANFIPLWSRSCVVSVLKFVKTCFVVYPVRIFVCLLHLDFNSEGFSDLPMFLLLKYAHALSVCTSLLHTAVAFHGLVSLHCS